MNTSEIDVDLVADYNKEIQTSCDKQATLAKFTQNTNQATADLIKQSYVFRGNARANPIYAQSYVKH